MDVFPHITLRVLKLLNDLYEQQTTESWSTYQIGIFLELNHCIELKKWMQRSLRSDTKLVD